MVDKEKVAAALMDIFSRALISGVDASMVRMCSRALSHAVCYTNNLPDLCILEIEAYINGKLDDYLEEYKRQKEVKE